MIDVEFFEHFYLAMKRRWLNNPFLKLSQKDKSKLPEVVDAINIIHASIYDFMHFMISYYSPARIFPTPAMLIAKRALMKYHYHQSLKNIYVFDDYMLNGDKFTVCETQEIVSYRNDIMCPIDKDIRLKSVMFILTKDFLNRTYTNAEKGDIAYTLAKLKYLEKPIPKELIQLKEKIDETDGL